MKFLIYLLILASPILKLSAQGGNAFPFLKKVAYSDAIATLQAQKATILESGYASQASPTFNADQIVFCKRLKGYFVTPDGLTIDFDLKSRSSPYSNFSPDDSLVNFDYYVKSQDLAKINTIAFQTSQVFDKGTTLGSAQSSVRSANVQITRDAWANATMLQCAFSNTKELELRVFVYE